MLSASYDNDSINTENVLLISRIAQAVISFVNDVLDRCLRAGFSRSNTSPPINPSRTTDRTLGAGTAVLAHLTKGCTSVDGHKANSHQESHLQQQHDVVTSASSSFNAINDNVPVSGGQFNPADMDPYLLELRNSSHGTLSDDKLHAINSKRVATNAAVAKTDIGKTAHIHHPAVQRIAEDFGLNRKQREAFYLFGHAWLSRNGTCSSDALRLYIGGGAGTGKSHVLRAIKALIECPAVRHMAPAGRLLTVAFQGKQASSVGGTTVHSVYDPTPRSNRRSSDGDEGTLSGSHDGQKPLPAKKAVHWQGVAVLAIEEVSTVSCDILCALHKAACSVYPDRAGLPFAGLIVVFLGDFNQLKPVNSRSLATPLTKLNSLERAGADFFKSANAAVMLNEDNNRFSKEYAPVMERLLDADCTSKDVGYLNARLLDGKNLGVLDCWDAKFITFRNKVSQNSSSTNCILPL